MVRLLFFLLLLFIHTSAILAQRNVKIATIGAAPSISNTKDPQKLVEMSIEFWKGRLQQVLPSKPDLIVLAEACDRPIGLTQQEQFAYFIQRKNQIQDFFQKSPKTTTVILPLAQSGRMKKRPGVIQLYC